VAGKIIADTIESAGSQISLNVGNVTVLTASSTGLTLIPTTNVNINLTNSIVNLTSGNVTNPSLTFSGNTSTGIFMPAANTIAFGTAGTEDMRITSTGDVGIGTNNPATYAGYTSLTINGTDSDIDLNRGGTRQLGIYTTSTLSAINNLANLPLAFYTNNTERMRIDSSGNLLVNTTSTAGNASTFKSTAGAGQQAVSFWNNATASTRYFVTFGTEATYTERGFITWNGTTTALSNASDFRLKENIVNAPSAMQKISDIQIRSFDFKEDGRHVEYGVIAQVLIEVIPAAVFEGSDNEDGSINKAWSVGLEPIIPVLVKAIQELKAIVDAQAVEIAALKAK
jgi:hypothetical protein